VRIAGGRLKGLRDLEQLGGLLVEPADRGHFTAGAVHVRDVEGSLVRRSRGIAPPRKAHRFVSVPSCQYSLVSVRMGICPDGH
jgi:hypothetical protein